jgi:flagellar assembly factor FliW
MSLNLLGPVIINAQKKIALQSISNNSDYGTREMVFQGQEQEEEVAQKA